MKRQKLNLIQKYSRCLHSVTSHQTEFLCSRRDQMRLDLCLHVILSGSGRCFKKKKVNATDFAIWKRSLGLWTLSFCPAFTFTVLHCFIKWWLWIIYEYIFPLRQVQILPWEKKTENPLCLFSLLIPRCVPLPLRKFLGDYWQTGCCLCHTDNVSF